jgi:hypothetical protein
MFGNFRHPGCKFKRDLEDALMHVLQDRFLGSAQVAK